MAEKEWRAQSEAQMMSQADKNGDQKLTKEEFSDLAATWFDKLDPDKAGKLSQEQFTERLGDVLPPPQGFGPPGGAPPGGLRSEAPERPRTGRGGFSSARFVGPGTGLGVAATTSSRGEPGLTR